MREIPVRVCGDYWLNPQELQHSWPADNSETVVLRLSGEGPSLWATGVVDAVLALCEQHARAPGTIWVGDWSNGVEETPFARFTQHSLSHFFWMSDSYRHSSVPGSTHRRWFGYFMGRANLHRARMLRDILDCHGDQTLISVMRHSGLDRTLQELADADWAPEDWSAFRSWCDRCHIPSLDDHTVRDQYDPAHNTNRDILAFYDQFRIEIVAETYTRGLCFFPTEKTVRPLSQGRGLLVYGPRGFLTRLRALGFQTWDSIWDETYDSAEGHLRWQLIQTEMHKIRSMDPNSVEHKLQEIHRHNREVFDQLVSAFRPQ